MQLKLHENEKQFLKHALSFSDKVLSFVLQATTINLQFLLNNQGQFLTYYLSFEDKDVTIELDFEENLSPSLNFIETSFDLFESEKFNFKPREDYMMPMPFVNTDAIVLSKKIKL